MQTEEARKNLKDTLYEIEDRKQNLSVLLLVKARALEQMKVDQDYADSLSKKLACCEAERVSLS